jgi:hypothetical protein
VNEQQYENEVRKAQLGHDYAEWLKTNVGQDIVALINREFSEAQNQIVLEQHQRTDKAETDTLRGRMQILSKIFQHINSVMRDAHIANTRLVESKKTS